MDLNEYGMSGKNLLDDLQEEVVIVPVGKGVRFANLLIDTICVYALFFIVVFTAVIIKLSNGGMVEDSQVFYFVLSYAILIGYFTVLEALTGRSVGKFITGTRVYRLDGQPLTWKDAFLRALIRLIPFEAFSGLGFAPWHDEWTKTTVGKK